MYNTARSECYLPDILMTVCKTISKCKGCHCMDKNFKHLRQLTLLVTYILIICMEIVIFGLVSRTKSGSKFCTIITDRCSSLSRALPTPKIWSSHITHIFLNHYITVYEVPDILLSNKVERFVNDCLISLGNYHGVKKHRRLRIIYRIMGM